MPWISCSGKSFVEPFPSVETLNRKAVNLETLGEDSLSFYEKAAKLGHEKSILKTAQLYLEKLNVDAAVKWFRRSKDPEAMNALGIMHLNGVGVARSDKLAFDYFHKAAHLGNYEAQYSLAELYYRGQGVSQDYVLAAKWFRESAFYLGRAQLMMGNISADGQGVPASQEQSIFWWRQAAEIGVQDAQYNLAITLLNIPGDHSESFRLFKRLSAENDSSAMNSLGNMFFYGDTVKQNYDLAFEYYKKSALLGNMNGQFNLAMSYGSGLGVDQDLHSAKEWCLKAANQGLVDAVNQMGVICDAGLGTPVDRKQAFQWYLKAAKRGFASAQFNVGLSYHKGLGVERDETIALHWYRLAAAGGINEENVLVSGSRKSPC